MIVVRIRRIDVERKEHMQEQDTPDTLFRDNTYLAWPIANGSVRV